MRSHTPLTLLLLAVLVGLAPRVYSQSAPVPGNCTIGTAEADLDVNNVLARVFTTGSLFYGNATTGGFGYLVPQASGNPPIFASGIWIGGQVNGELRIAGSTYDDFEFWPGPLNDDGTLPDPAECAGANGISFDKIWRVSKADILNFEGGAGAAPDLASWPVTLGAPVIAAPGNGFDDDGDGDIDEGSDGVDNDEDGFVDERDEQERVDPDLRLAAGRGAYDLAAGDRPEIIGDQALWWVMNDLGNTHQNTLRPPIGVEVQVLMWSFARADALNDITFYRYRVTKKTPGVMEDTYFSIFSDPDLGDASDDFVGVDTTLSLGFVYNDADEDDVYGVPPATGYDFFQGPIVDLDGDGIRTDTLGVTRFSYFRNEAAGGPTSDPTEGVSQYNYMQGLWADGSPMTAFGTGYLTDGDVTLFAFPGDPVTGQFWSEENTDNMGSRNTGGDRRFLVTTGPFNLEPGVSQDIVFGIVFGQGGDRLQSITAMRQADQLAQSAYDVDFELPSAPPAPPLCDANSPNPQLQPGSGNCLEGVEIDGQGAIVWGYPTNSSNYLGGYETTDFLLLGQDAADSTYNFQGFNVYRYPNSNFDDSQRERVATYDIIDGIAQVVDVSFDPVIADFVPFIAANGSDSGIQYFYIPGNLTNYTDYYFGVSAYAYNDESVPKVIESAASKITFRPSDVSAGSGGALQQSDLGDVIVADQSAGNGRGQVVARVVDPTQITGATYSVEIFEFIPEEDGDEEDAVQVFRILRDGEVVFDGQEAFETAGVINEIRPRDDDGAVIAQLGQQIVIDGLSFISITEPVPTFAGDVTNTDDISEARFAGDGVAGAGGPAGIIEVATADGTGVCEGVSESPADDNYDPGCRFYDGNTVAEDANRTDQYFVTSGSSFGSLIQEDIIFGDDFEMRFTEACATAGNCLGAYLRNDGEIVSVPFELWNVGDLRTPDDDVRMIPLIRTTSGSDPFTNWADNFPDTFEDFPAAPGDTIDVPLTHRVFFSQPDRPDGYALFEADARAFGGPGAIYDRDNDNDTQIDLNANGDECAQQGAYIDFCYRSVAPYRAAVGGSGSAGLQVADLAMDGTTPAAGTVIRFLTAPKPVVNTGDVYTFDTSGIAFLTNQGDAAEAALETIGIVPNPYLGVSAYETNNLDRVARFINLPEVATIRIYTVAGTLVETLRKEGPSRSLDWNLTTHNNLPVASGMYYIHVDVPGVGERVLKFGVVNRKNRITIF